MVVTLVLLEGAPSLYAADVASLIDVNRDEPVCNAEVTMISNISIYSCTCNINYCNGIIMTGTPVGD